MNLAVSITALFSDLFIVVMGGLADKIGRVKIALLGLVANIIGSFLVRGVDVVDRPGLPRSYPWTTNGKPS